MGIFHFFNSNLNFEFGPVWYRPKLEPVRTGNRSNRTGSHWFGEPWSPHAHRRHSSIASCLLQLARGPATVRTRAHTPPPPQLARSRTCSRHSRSTAAARACPPLALCHRREGCRCSPAPDAACRITREKRELVGR